jgi:NAD(P)-dependent dehydrogenase (short-subunit alcohol dehydrogenase family)
MSALRGARIDARHLSGNTAVVTGAGSGIGRSLAALLARRGALVHAADLDGESAEAVAQEIRDTGGTALAHSVDVADADAVARLANLVFTLKRVLPPAAAPCRWRPTGT